MRYQLNSVPGVAEVASVGDLQANRRSNCVITGRFFLPTGKTKESDKKKDSNRNFHSGSKFGFVRSTRADEATSKHNGCNDANSKVE